MDRIDIRRVALNRFCEQGFHATTLRQLAADLGVTAGSLYHHYKTKEALLADLIESILLYNLRELRATIAASPNRLEGAIYYHVHSHCLERSEAFVIQHDFRALPAQYRQSADKLLAEYEAEFMFLMREQIAAGSLPEQDLVLATKAIMGVGIYAAHWFHPEGPLDASDVAQWYVDACLSMLHRNSMGTPETGATSKVSRST